MPSNLDGLPEAKVLRKVWLQNYEREELPPDVPSESQGTPPVRYKAERELPSSAERLKSPYGLDARYRRKKGGQRWTGYYAYLTEMCDENWPRLLTHVDTTDASVHEAMRTKVIHTALSEKKQQPAKHLVDAAYVSASHLARARRSGIDLVGPTRPNVSGQAGGRFGQGQFDVDWEQQKLQCPEGKTSTSWRTYEEAKRGCYIKVRFAFCGLPRLPVAAALHTVRETGAADKPTSARGAGSTRGSSGTAADTGGASPTCSPARHRRNHLAGCSQL